MFKAEDIGKADLRSGVGRKATKVSVTPGGVRAGMGTSSSPGRSRGEGELGMTVSRVKSLNGVDQASMAVRAIHLNSSGIYSCLG